ncbi:MAG: polynucleotide adenylyltransferase, partial [Lachnospiraceae bacterium]|nr:polynucleotide adenylyltransferase [Candidatus Darwinimomas equi]
MIIPKEAENITRLLRDNTHDAYIVGGCVRDALLGRTPNDWDITTDARPEEIKRIFRRTADTGIQHGTVTVIINGKGYEVTTYRVDGDYSDHRRPDTVEFTDSLFEDLKRRDFTINAMAYNHDRGLVDEFGGQEDLSKGLVRCVGEPDERFNEDALRILRAIRFSAGLGIEIEEKTLGAIGGHIKDLTAVSPERIMTELNKIIRSDHPE